ncbi:Gluconate transport-inducing protein [Coemansia sp. RSA 1200]|nr:Gluconate transport-inducing protein [Coemansia sp. RSA 1200]
MPTMVIRNDHSTTETYHGYVETTDDALRIFEACRRGILRRRSRRLCESERKEITSGSLFVWEERESGIRRWTDSRRWSPSRVNGCFLVYSELHPKPTAAARNTSADMPLDDGLVKKALSLFTNSSSKLHLVCYYRKSDVDQGRLKAPATDPLLRDIVIPRSLYPDVIPDAVEAGVGEAASSTPSAGMLTPGGCGIGSGGRRLSVAVCPLLGTQNQDRRLSSCLQTHDYRLVASTQPCLIHSDPAEPPSPIVAGRAAAPMPSGLQMAASQKLKLQQQQAIKALSASSHATTPADAESISRPSDRSNSSNNDSNSSESTLFSAESAMAQKPAGRISPSSAKALHRRLRLPAINLHDRSHSQQLRPEELPTPAGQMALEAAAYTSADAGQMGGAPAWFQPMGCATAPSSRRSTLVDGSYFPAPPNDNRSSSNGSPHPHPHPHPCAPVDSRCGGEEDPSAAAIRLPPMSELLRSINSNSTVRSSPADTEAKNPAAAAVENTRAKYARVPWNSNNKHQHHNHRHSGAARGSDTLLPSLHLPETSQQFLRRDYAKATRAVSPDISSSNRNGRNLPMAMPMAAAAAPPSMFAASVPLHSYSIR